MQTGVRNIQWDSREITTFFVTNTPAGAHWGELREIFKKFGEVVYVFVASKRRRNRQYYAFVRYKGVTDVLGLERAINGVTYRGRKLVVNVSKHQRREPSLATGSRKMRAEPQVHKKVQTHDAFRDRRSYADVTSTGKRPGDAVNDNPTINIQSEEVIKRWIGKTTLIGAALSLNHLGHLLSLLALRNKVNFEIKYIRGLRVLFVFNYTVEREIDFFITKTDRNL